VLDLQNKHHQHLEE